MKLIHQKKESSRLNRQHILDFPVHLHNAVELVLLLEGSSVVLQSDGKHPLAAGDLYLSFPMQPHGYENSQNIDAYVWIIPITPYLVPYQSLLEQKLPSKPILHRQHWETAGIGQLIDMAAADQNIASVEIMQGYIQLILGKILGLMTFTARSSTGADAMEKLLLFLNTHYQEPITRKQIAHAIGYNESYISHLFTDVFHITLTDYLTALRLEDGARFLRETDTPVSQLALSVGFGSIRSFHRAFSQKFGMSPREYRSKNR